MNRWCPWIPIVGTAAGFTNPFLRAVFNWESKVIARLLWFCFRLLCDWLLKFAPLSQPMRPKPIVPRSHPFSRAWHRLHVFASNSDWSIVLFTFSVIGRSNYFGFGFTTLKWKPLYKNISCRFTWFVVTENVTYLFLSLCKSMNSNPFLLKFEIPFFIKVWKRNYRKQTTN